LCFFYIFICYLQVYRGVPPTTAQQLEVRIWQAYDNLPQEMIQLAIDAVPARMRLCEQERGDSIVKWTMWLRICCFLIFFC
jgi:hypothetical protein